MSSLPPVVWNLKIAVRVIKTIKKISFLGGKEPLKD